MRAVALLSWWQLRNSLRSVFRDPAKLVSLLVFAAWLAASQWTGSANPLAHLPFPPEYARLLSERAEWVRAGVFLFLVMLAAGVLDAGFSLSFLSFSPADVSFLFPAPVSRRTVLLYQVPRITARFFPISLLVLPLFSMFVAQPVAAQAPGGALPGTGLGLPALLLCFACYSNAALAAEIVLGRRPGVRLGLQLLLGLGLLGLGGIAWLGGFDAAARLAGSPLLVVPFYPCHLAAEVLTAPLSGRGAPAAAAQLLLIYGATLALALTRRQDFYERAAVGVETAELARSAAREQNAAALAALELGERPVRRRLYAFPRFGRGAGALAWAILAAAAKRPWSAFWGPMAAGAGLTVAMSRDPETALPLLCVVNFTTAWIAILVGTWAQGGHLRREPLVRPLPFPAWQAVLGDVLPRVLLSSLFNLASGLTLLLMPLPERVPLVLAMLLCLPAAQLCAHLLAFSFTFWFTNAGDRLQQALAPFLFAGAILGLGWALSPAVLVPLRLGADLPAAMGCLTAALLCLAGLLLALAASVYARSEAEGEAPSLARLVRSLWEGDRRLPTAAEGMALVAVQLVLALHFGPLLLTGRDLRPLLLGSELLFIVLPVLLFAGAGRYRWPETFSWRRPSARMLAGGLLVGIGIVPWAAGFGYLQNRVWTRAPAEVEGILRLLIPPLHDHPVLSVAALGLLAGVCEELLFRGALQTALLRRLPPFPALLLGGFLFAAAHGDVQGIPLRTALGVLLGWTVLRTGSLFPAMVMHAAIDWTALGTQSWAIRALGPEPYLELASRAEALPPAALPYFAGALGAGATLLVLGGLLLARSAPASRPLPAVPVLAALVGLGLVAVLPLRPGSAGAALGQGVVGTWSGQLGAGPKAQRLVVRIRKRPADGRLTARLDGPSPVAASLPIERIEFRERVLRLEIRALNGRYEGRLDRESTAIDGEWRQGAGAGRRLVLVRASDP